MYPHELFLVSDPKERGVSWATVDYSSRLDEEDEQNQQNANNGQNFSKSTKSNYDLNYVSYSGKTYEVTMELYQHMMGAKMAFTDLMKVVQSLGTHQVEVDWVYSGTFSISKIREMRGKSLKELEACGYIERNKVMQVMQTSKDDRGAQSTMLCTHCIGKSTSPNEILKQAIRSLIYKGMKPCRLTLGIMSNANRGCLDYLDITEKDIQSSKRNSLEVATGSYMTDRERSILCVSLNEELGKHVANNTTRVEDMVGGDDDNDIEVNISHGESQERNEFETMLENENSVTHGLKTCRSLKIFGDVNEWGIKRYFMKSGIPMGIHPCSKELVWLHMCEKDGKKMQYRKFPTTYNQRMRSIAYAQKFQKERFSLNQKHYYVDPKIVKEAQEQEVVWLKSKSGENAVLNKLSPKVTNDNSSAADISTSDDVSHHETTSCNSQTSSPSKDEVSTNESSVEEPVCMDGGDVHKYQKTKPKSKVSTAFIKESGKRNEGNRKRKKPTSDLDCNAEMESALTKQNKKQRTEHI